MNFETIYNAAMHKQASEPVTQRQVFRSALREAPVQLNKNQAPVGPVADYGKTRLPQKAVENVYNRSEQWLLPRFNKAPSIWWQTHPFKPQIESKPNAAQQIMDYVKKTRKAVLNNAAGKGVFNYELNK